MDIFIGPLATENTYLAIINSAILPCGKAHQAVGLIEHVSEISKPRSELGSYGTRIPKWVMASLKCSCDGGFPFMAQYQLLKQKFGSTAFSRCMY